MTIACDFDVVYFRLTNYKLLNLKVLDQDMKNKFLLISSIVMSFFAANTLNAEELIRYSDKGDILGRYQCDAITVRESAQQDELICSKRPQIALNITLKKILNQSGFVKCFTNPNCVVIGNKRDPNWRPVALYGLPDASFGRLKKGSSCARIQETVPDSTSWAKDNWQLCTNHPDLEIAYTYALGHPNEGLAKRFKDESTQRVCFNRVLERYKHHRYWTDNCIFVRQK